jgi:hypothetical protein
MSRALALPLLLALVPACDEGSPASPSFQGGEAGVGYAVCPTGMTPSFDSIYAQMLNAGSMQIDGQQGCGANVPGNCHSGTGSSQSSLLDFSLDENSVYTELLGPDGGGGKLATNVSGSAHILRVAPGDAGASMLYVKITLDASADPQYGSGMPYTAPGSVCPQAVEAVKAWIDMGAPAGTLDLGADAGSDASDASSDAKAKKDARDDAPSDAVSDATSDATTD